VAAAKKFPQSEFVQWAAGELFLRKKNYPVAARYFQSAVKAKAQSGRAQFGLAKALFESGREEEALEPFTQACKLEPNSIETFMAATGRMKQKGRSELTQKYIKASNTCR
jgi:Flp pilus assembly protein TadD